MAMLRRLRWKFILIIMLLVTAVLASVLTVQTGSAIAQFRGETDRVLQAALRRSEALLDPWGEGWTSSLEQDDELYTAIPASCAVLDRNTGRKLLAVRFNSDIELSSLDRAVELALATGDSSGLLRKLDLRFQIRAHGSLVCIAFADLTWEQTAVRQQVVTALLTLGAALLGFFVVSLSLSRWLVRPVEESWKQQRRFVADASHELKTPLTVLLADTDILLAHPSDTIESQRKWVEHIQAEGLRMKGLVQDLLFLARGDADEIRERPQERVALSDLCWNCLLSFEPVAFEQGLVLEDRIDPNVTVTGAEEELRRLIVILLDNACKYCEPGGTVTVTLTGGERALLAVHNTGAPIPAEAQPHLFERFYRADPSRSRDQGGYGLGLAIAAAVAERHRGRIDLHSAAGEGTVFTVALPVCFT